MTKNTVSAERNSAPVSVGGTIALDATDLTLLQELEADGRASFSALAEAAGLSKTPCWNRVQALEERGVVTGYGAKLNASALGLNVHAYVEVMIDFMRHADFESAVIKNPSILECHTTAGNADYLLRVVCRDVEDLDDLLRRNISLMPGVQRSVTMICLKSIKGEGSIINAAKFRLSYSPTFNKS